MRKSHRTTFALVFFISTLVTSCSKDPHWAYFTSDDLQWMPYDTALVHDTFVDESGNAHILLLIHRNIVHENIGDESRAAYNNHAVAELLLDTTHIVIDLTKTPHRSWIGGWFDELELVAVVGDGWLREEYINEMAYADTLVIGSTVYDEVIVVQHDTASWSPNQQCWRFYYARDHGLLRADFRNGHFYEIQ